MRKYFRILLIPLIIFAHSSLAKAEKVRICHISSRIDSILPSAKDTNLMHSGFSLGISEANKNIEFLKFQGRAKSSILSNIDWAKRNKCLVVVGIVTSKDALLVGPSLVKERIFGISSTATNDGIKTYSKYLMSLSISAKAYANDIVELIHNRKSIYLIYKKNEIYSVFFKNYLRKKLKHIHLLPLNRNNKINLNKISSFDSTFIYTTYPFQSIPSLAQIRRVKGGQYNIIGNPAWNETHVFRGLENIIPKKDRISILTPIDINNPNKEYKYFLKRFTKTYNEDPDHDSLYDYDVIGYISTCLAKFNYQVKYGAREKFYDCLRKTKNYSGVTGLYQFKKGSAHPKRRQFKFNLLTEGLIPKMEAK